MLKEIEMVRRMEKSSSHRPTTLNLPLRLLTTCLALDQPSV